MIDHGRGEDTSAKLVDIESTDRLAAVSIGALSDRPELLRQYFESSAAHTFSELLFRLTHEKHTEARAATLWGSIVAHRALLHGGLGRDVGLLVAALDYLTNISGEMASPKIIDDLRLEEAAHLATRDALTGLYRRAVFDASLDRLVCEHVASRTPLALLMLDVDDFKQVNDASGHDAGDGLLRTLGKTMLAGLRKCDVAARYGGEEFAVIFPGTSLQEAMALAERLRADLAATFAESKLRITTSVGIAALREPDVMTGRDLIRHADDALYEAKRTGKDRACRAI